MKINASKSFVSLFLAFLLASIAACSSRPSEADRVISFGDSLSDLGTYANRTEGKSEGRWTTNPGPLWVEVVALSLRTTIKGYRRAGWGYPEQILGGFGYGEGGSRVALQPGINNTDDSEGLGSRNTTTPVREQVSLHMKRDEFRANDVVLLCAGANDVMRSALFAPVPAFEDADRLVRDAATALALEALRISRASRPRVVVLTIDNLGEVPVFRNSPASEKLTRLSTLFNDVLRHQLAGTPVLLVDIWKLLTDARNNPGAVALKNVTSAACDIESLPFRSVLFCTKQTVVSSDADSTYLYADGLHFTTAGNHLIAEAVLRALNDKGGETGRISR